MVAYAGGQSEAVAVVRLVSCSLSVLGAVLIVVSYTAFAEHRTFGRRLLVWLSAADLLAAVFYALPASEGEPACGVQAVGISFFAMAAVAMTTFIAFFLARTARGADASSLPEAAFHLCAWPPAAALAVFVSLKSARFEETWCWLPAGPDDLAFYVPLWCAWVANAALYHVSTAVVRKGGPGSGSLRRLVFVPLVFIVLRLPGSAHRAYRLFGGGHVRWLSLLQAAGDPGQGAADAVLFVIANDKVRASFARALGLATGDADADADEGAGGAYGSLLDTKDDEDSRAADAIRAFPSWSTTVRRGEDRDPRAGADDDDAGPGIDEVLARVSLSSPEPD